ncbi:hypothetical protein PAV_15c00500 [Paenibacillus alvei DSM 29]|nr:hypothetical protein PAV_15c00500 [Paenibacillus alvei DSM 29]
MKSGKTWQKYVTNFAIVGSGILTLFLGLAVGRQVLLNQQYAQLIEQREELNRQYDQLNKDFLKDMNALRESLSRKIDRVLD